MNTLPIHNRTARRAQHTPKQTALFATATLVTVLSIAERSLGFLYRVVLSRLIGAEALGLYQIALSLFAVFLTLGTGGIPISVSRLTAKANAENNPRAKRSAVSAGFTLCLLFTLPVLCFFLLFADKIPILFSDDRAVPVFKILLLGLCLSSIYAVIRGYFWGEKNFLTPSLIELAEEIVMVVSGILLLRSAHSVVDGAQKAAWAAMLSYLFSFTLSMFAFFYSGGKLFNPKKQLKPLFNAAMPITSVRTSATLINSAIAVLLPAMLIKSGLTESQALRFFGVVTGMAMPVLFIPSTIIGSLSLVLVPELSQDYYKGNTTRLYHNITRGVRFAFFVSCFLAPFFFVLGKPLGALAFNEVLAGEYIQKGCLLLLPMSLTMITTGILNSIGYEKKTFVFYFVGAAGALLCILLLPKYFGAFSYIIALFISHILTGLCNFICLEKECKGLFRILFFDKKTLAFSAAAVLPISLIGALFFAIFSNFLSGVLLSACTGIFMLTLSFIVYKLFKIIPRFSFLKEKRIRK